jgi:hypothetical protein
VRPGGSSPIRHLLGAAALLSGCAEGLPAHTSEPALRPDDPAANEPRYAPGTRLESRVSPGGAFRVHFTRTGDDAVLGADTATPAYVLDVAEAYDAALAHFADLGFRRPEGDEGAPRGDGGDGRFDVYLIDFFGRGDGQFRTDACTQGDPSICAGHMRHENDFAGYGYPSLRIAHRILASHELFHAVQAAYAAGEPGPLTEGTAVWATESFDGRLADFEGFIRAFLAETGRSLETDGGFDGWIYGAALFFRFLEEAYGPEVMRELWEARGRPGRPASWLLSLDGVLARRGASFSEAFLRFSRWNLALGTSTSEERYREAARYPAPSARQETLPLDTGRLRVFPASMRIFAVEAGGRPGVAAELAGPPAELADLWLVVGARDGTWAPEIAPATSGDLAVEGAEAIWAAVIDTRLEGSSRRPVLCAGDAREVAACRAAATGASEGPDAGAMAPDAGPTTPDAGPMTPDAGVAVDSGVESSGCACARPAPRRGPILALFSLVAVGLGGARRRWRL